MRLPWPLLVYTAAVLITVWASDGQIHSRVRLLMPAFLLLLPVALGLARRRTGTAVAVVVAAALGLLAGCSGGSEDGGGKASTEPSVTSSAAAIARSSTPGSP